MRNDSTEKTLKLIVKLLDGADHKTDDICKEMEISRRTLYYILGALRSSGFIIFKSNGCYHIDRRSPFVNEVINAVQFSNDELVTIWNLLNMVGSGNETVNMLRRKLDRAYDFSTIVNTPEARQHANKVRKLSQAIERKRMVKLIDYSSPHSHSVRDRIVEPYMMMNSNRDVRCNEISTGMNKTFKLARMGDVEILDTPWIHEDLHKQMFTDVFMFSGEEHHNVKMRLGQLSKNLFLEEYPQGAKNVSPDDTDDNHWVLELEVCDYRGIGRFVLGLYDDIEILADDDFKLYIANKIKSMYSLNFPDQKEA